VRNEEFSKKLFNFRGLFFFEYIQSTFLVIESELIGIISGLLLLAVIRQFKNMFINQI
jgi:hypothetical protein